MSLCPSCRADDEAWRDSYPVQHGIRIHTIGKPLTRAERAEEHYARVRWQRDHIARICAEKHQTAALIPQEAPRVGSLFSGYGGLDMAITATLGGSVAWHSEIDPGACKILAHRYPDVPNIGDITAVDWSGVEPVDVLTGGFPCQDVSVAGLRKGLKPDTRSGLWSHFAYAIERLRPELVVIENVRGLLSAEAHSDLEPCPWCVGDGGSIPLRALGAVLGDLAGLGYDASWQGLRAADVGAPHGRFRVFVCAWPASDTDGVALRLEPVRESSGGSAPIAGHAGLKWGPYGGAIRDWERVTRPAPPPTELSKGRPRLSPTFVEWMMGLPAGWVTDIPGLSRNDQLKALGNGVVPQQATKALRMLLPDAMGVAA